jgi:hypothetical protein
MAGFTPLGNLVTPHLFASARVVYVMFLVWFPVRDGT